MKKILIFILTFCALFPFFAADSKDTDSQGNWISKLSSTINSAWSSDSAKCESVNKLIADYSAAGDFSEKAQGKFMLDLAGAGVKDANCIQKIADFTANASASSGNNIQFSQVCNALSQENLACAIDSILADDPEKSLQARDAVREYIDGKESGNTDPQKLSAELKECGIQSDSSLKQLVSAASDLAKGQGTDNFSALSQSLESVKQTEFSLQFQNFIEIAYGDKGDAVKDAVAQYMGGKQDEADKQALKQTLKANGLDDNAISVVQQTSDKLAQGTCTRSDLDQARMDVVPAEIKSLLSSNPDYQKDLDALTKKVEEMQAKQPSSSSSGTSGTTSTETNSQLTSLKDKISNMLPGNIGDTITDKISDFVSKGNLSDAAFNLLQQELQKAGITDPDALQTIKNTVEKIVSGSADFSDISNAASAIGKNVLVNYVNNLNIDDAVKKQVISLITQGDFSLAELTKDEIAGLLQKCGVPQDQIDAVLSLTDSFIKSVQSSDWSILKNDIEKITAEQLANVLDKQLQKLLDKYPFLSDIFQALGINKGSIENFLSNLKWTDVRNMFNNFISQNWSSFQSVFKNLASNLSGVLTKLVCKKVEEYVDDAMKELYAKLSEILNGNAFGLYIVQQSQAGAAVVQSAITSGIQKAIQKKARQWQYILTK